MTPESARAEFPLLTSCVYLNSNSMGAFPRGARYEADRYYDTIARWRDEDFDAFMVGIRAYADEIASFIGAAKGTVTLDGSVSLLLGRLLSAFDFRERPRVVTSDLEFPSVGHLLGAFRHYGCEPVVVPSIGGVVIDAEGIAAAIDERTLMVIVSHAAFTSGALTDLAPIARRARELGALVVVDAYQSIGVVPFDVAALDVDVVLGGAHKWLCGAIDSAFAYVRPEVVRSLEPAAGGWMAGRDPFSFTTGQGFGDGAARLNAGTPAPLPPLTSREGLRIVRTIGVHRIRRLSIARTTRIIDRADSAGITVATPRDSEARAGVVNLTFPRSAEVVRALGRDGFICSHRRGARIAPHFYNTDEEVERFMDALVATIHQAR